MKNEKKALILVGHGGIPSDIPEEIVKKFMRVHKVRVKSGGPISEQELELDNTIRMWERTQETDPYKSGLELLASHMDKFLPDYIIKTAYNEFCYPTIEQSVDQLVKQKVEAISIVTTMVTRGGSHSEVEIPEEVKELRLKYADIQIQYAWPFDMDSFALFLSTHVKIFNNKFSVSAN